MDTYTLLYSEWITNKDLLYGTGNSAQCYVAAWMGGMLGREWIHIYIHIHTHTHTYTHTYIHTHTHTHTHTAESLPCSPETTTTLLMGYSLKQSKGF